MLFLAGAIFLIIGVLSLSSGDFMWSWQKFGNDLEGQVSRRTGAWEARRILSGVAFVLIGLALIVAGFAI